MAAYALTIFTGAFLLFQVQPLIAKYILPWFGGGPGVWTTCMLFFQIVLVAGYAYAHFVPRHLRPRNQFFLHLCFLASALAMLPITPADSWKPVGGGNPAFQILTLLAATIGVPYFVLSTTGPLLQHWFSLTNARRSPYRLYALSNFGSLLALVSFPFLVEPHFTRKTQTTLWGCGLGVYVIACIGCAMKLLNLSWDPASRKLSNTHAAGEAIPASPTPHQTGGPSPQLPSLRQRLFWLLLPACASTLLLATTNKLCLDVAVIPFLWILPLALYLLSFIICFDNPRWYARFPFTILLIVASAAISWALFEGTGASLTQQVIVYSLGLFVCCMVCHGELYRLRPDPSQLTGFYLMIASGGALGGFFVAVLAPLIFNDYYEMHWGLFLCGFLFIAVCIFDRPRPPADPASSPAASRSALRRALETLISREWVWLASTLPVLAFLAIDRSIVQLQAHHSTIPKGYFIGSRLAMWSLLLLLAGNWIARKQFKKFQYWRALTCIWLSLGLILLGVVLLKQAGGAGSEKIYTSRNFYGVLTIYEHRKDEPLAHHFLLQHGRITHGLQFVDPTEAAWPTTYYCTASGIGQAVHALPDAPRRIGVVGLGTGTMAAFGRTGDYLHIYEINQQVQQLATSRFSYLSNCAARVEISLGDARLSLEREPPQQFDLLVLDAFSSDAIPVHLLTKEAFEVYSRHLNSNGVIAVHISNHYLNLEPVVMNLARHFSFKLALIDYDEDEAEDEWWNYSSSWILLTHHQVFLDSPAIRAATSELKTNQIPLWTDDFASLFQILRN